MSSRLLGIGVLSYCYISVAMYKNAVLNALVHRNHSDIYPKLQKLLTCDKPWNLSVQSFDCLGHRI